MATFTKKEQKIYQNICHLSERSVLTYMRDLCKCKYDKDAKIIARAPYLMAQGNIPIILVAHADTVFPHSPRVEDFYYDQEKDVIWNVTGAGADDRAGVYAISYLVRETDFRPHIVITTDEEIGCVGANKLVHEFPDFPWDARMIIQLDRRGYNDSVYYDCDNPDLEKWINEFGFQTAFGSFTDISVLGPVWGLAAVNLSIGYMDEHTTAERLHVDWMYRTIDKVIEILKQMRENAPAKFPYIEKKWSYVYSDFPGWNDSDYQYLPIPKGSASCVVCGEIDAKSNMIEFWYPHGIRPYNICLSCYSQMLTQIVWCKQCGRAMYLPEDQAKKITDVNDWMCEDCKNGLSKNSEKL